MISNAVLKLGNKHKVQVGPGTEEHNRLCCFGDVHFLMG